MKYKYYWYYCTKNGMIEKLRKNPDDKIWIGPFDTIRDLKALTAHLPVPIKKLQSDTNETLIK
jgi:hypothetical protein